MVQPEPPNQPTFSDYIVFVDESGDHSLDSINPQYPVFVLAFCVFLRKSYIDTLTPAVRRLKCDLFGHDLVVLHEHDIRKRSGPFAALSKDRRAALFDGLTAIIESCDMTLIAVVIDKPRHKQRYVNPLHPYHLAMQFGLERVYSFLRGKGENRTTPIIFEARGKREDEVLELEFLRVCAGANRSGSSYPFQIVVADKKTNSEGLQLADLVARPIGLHVLRPEQPNRTWEILLPKFYTGLHGAVIGNGLKVFP